GQLEARLTEPDAQAEDIHLEAFHAARGDAEEPGERELDAVSARRRGDDALAEEILADRGGGQVDVQLRHRAREPGGEGIRVGSRPKAVVLGVRVVVRRLVDARDHLVHAGAALLGVELGLGAEPAPVRGAVADDERGVLPAQPPADDLVYGPLPRIGRRYRHPGVHAEESLPAERARAVDLDHRLARGRRVGREADRLAAERAPVLRGERARDEAQKNTEEIAHQLPYRRFTTSSFMPKLWFAAGKAPERTSAAYLDTASRIAFPASA